MLNPAPLGAPAKTIMNTHRKEKTMTTTATTELETISINAVSVMDKHNIRIEAALPAAVADFYGTDTLRAAILCHEITHTADPTATTLDCVRSGVSRTAAKNVRHAYDQGGYKAVAQLATNYDMRWDAATTPELIASRCLTHMATEFLADQVIEKLGDTAFDAWINRSIRQHDADNLAPEEANRSFFSRLVTELDTTP